MSSKSRPSGTTTTVQKADPWAPQQPYLQDIFTQAQGLYQGPGPQYYPGATYASPNWTQNAALDQLSAVAQGNPLPGQAGFGAQQFISGEMMQGNPSFSTFGALMGSDNATAQALDSYLSGSRLGADNPYTDALVQSITSRVLPGIQSQFIAGGTLSSPEAARASSAGVTSAVAPELFRHQQMEEQNQMQAAQLLGNLNLQAATGANQAYSNSTNDMLRSLALAPQISQMLYEPYQTMYQAGSLMQGQDQNAINDAVQRWNYGQTLPYERLNQYIGSVTGNYGGTSTLTQPYFANSAGMNALGGAMGGAQLGSMFFPTSAAALAAGATPWGSAIGGGIGALFGLLSDRRAKEDIEPVGELDNGLTVYAYRYKGEPEGMRHIGLMADEVEEENPEAVGTLPPMFGALGGLKYVDYARAVE